MTDHEIEVEEIILGDASGEYLRAYYKDTTVNQLQRRRIVKEKIIAVLVAEKEQLRNRIVELESIAPRRMMLPDGKIVVWHCTDDLIPLSRL